MIEYKQGQLATVLVRVMTEDGRPVAGMAPEDLSVTLLKSNGVTQQLVATAQNWKEISAGAFGSEGVYLLTIPSSGTDITGLLSYAVKATGVLAFIGAVKVVAREEGETFARLGEPTGASIAADIAALHEDTDILRRYQEGRWKMHVTGPDAGRIVYYDSDGVTPLAKFALKNRDGQPSINNAIERVPVS